MPAKPQRILASHTYLNETSRMKRSRDDPIAMGDDSNSYPPLREEEEEEEHEQERAACDILLSLSCSGSSSSNNDEEAPGTAAAPPCNKHRRRRHRRGRDAFECQTCGRQFATFQALGGHRTSHFRRRPATKLRPKEVAVVHVCGTCGMGFVTGQALGGHMRRHRGGGPASATEKDFGYVGFTQIIMQERRPTSASMQLLNLFV